MAETQSAHRQALEAAVVGGNVAAEARGHIFGFVITMTAVVGGIGLIANGKSTEGLVAIITALSALAGVFVWGRVQQKRERDAKLQQNNAMLGGASAQDRN